MLMADCDVDSIHKQAEQHQARNSRLLKEIERRGGGLAQDPEETTLHTTAYDADRTQLLNTLEAFAHTFGEQAPYPYEGRIPGTWDPMLSCHAQKLLTVEEFSEIGHAVGR